MRHTLLLLRHAEAYQESSGSNDFDRPLSDQGKAKAIDVANWLNEHTWTNSLRGFIMKKDRQICGFI